MRAALLVLALALGASLGSGRAWEADAPRVVTVDVRPGADASRVAAEPGVLLVASDIFDAHVAAGPGALVVSVASVPLRGFDLARIDLDAGDERVGSLDLATPGASASIDVPPGGIDVRASLSLRAADNAPLPGTSVIELRWATTLTPASDA